LGHRITLCLEVAAVDLNRPRAIESLAPTGVRFALRSFEPKTAQMLKTAPAAAS